MSDLAPVAHPAKVFQAPSLQPAGAYSRQAKLKQENKQRELLEKLKMEKMIERAKQIQRKQEEQ